MRDIVERLRDHDRHAVHDEDDDCCAAADTIAALRGLLIECREVMTERDIEILLVDRIDAALAADREDAGL
jgi:hypothetical protein